MKQHTNHLINETSPYLLQHAHNPVDWYPWGKEALERAKEEVKPILLSIGYSTCHWCHVMERESFEDEDVARILNADFICIKVDREERPDLDEIYMQAIVAISGQGGWPLNVFLTPQLKPFFGGTYFPPEDKWERLGFKRLARLIAEKWSEAEERDKLINDSESLTQMIEERNESIRNVETEGRLEFRLQEKAFYQITKAFDSEWGGFGRAPKFPPTNTIAFLLRYNMNTGDSSALRMAELTLDRMYEGGMYDHLAGGFHRYSTDAMWHVPHFEKMLYDNALLAIVYLEASQLTGSVRYGRIAEDILDYILKDMTSPEGGFFSAEDADSEGEEGTYYLWTEEEIKKLLTEDEFEAIKDLYNIRSDGNFPVNECIHMGQNILHLSGDQSGKFLKGDLANKNSPVFPVSARKKLLEARGNRSRPSRDDKILTSWNGLMITAFSRAYQILGKKRYLDAATDAARFISSRLRSKEGRLLRTFRKGSSKINGYSEDYAYMIRALIDLYESGFDEKWLFLADELTGDMINLFWDEKSPGFFDTESSQEDLIIRTKTAHDSAIPSPIGVMVTNLFRLGILLDNADYTDRAVRILEGSTLLMERAPQAHLSLLLGLDYFLHSPREIAIVGKAEDPETARFFKALHSRFTPNRIISFLDTANPDAVQIAQKIPLLSGKTTRDGKTTAYVCQNYACKEPTTSIKTLLRLIAE
ncbi:thioredoxin domain-containing protein [Acidobacteriota bacterium]